MTHNFVISTMYKQQSLKVDIFFTRKSCHPMAHGSSSDFTTLRAVQYKCSKCTQHPPYYDANHTYAILLSNITIVCPVTLLSIACHAVPLTSALEIFLSSLQIFLDTQNANCIFTKQYELIYYKHVVPKCCSKIKYSSCRIWSCITLFTYMVGNNLIQ